MLTKHEFENWLSLVQQQLNIGEKQSRQLCEELQDHFESTVEELCAAGMDEPTAVATALDEFGEADLIADNLRTVLLGNRKRWMMNAGKLTFATIGIFWLAAMALWPAGTGTQNSYLVDGSETTNMVEAQGQSETSKANAKIRQLLNTKASLVFDENEFSDVVDFLSQELKCNVLIDPNLEGELDMSTKFSSNLVDIRMADALKLGLEPYNGTYIVKHGALKIISIDDQGVSDYQSRHLVDVGSLLKRITEKESARIGQPFIRSSFGIGLSREPRGGGVFRIGNQLANPAQLDSRAQTRPNAKKKSSPTELLTAEVLLTHTITSMIQTDCWMCNGMGESEITCLGGVLILKCHESTADEVKNFLVDLELALSK